MRYDKSLKQVLDWKDAIYKKSKDKSIRGISSTIRKEAAALKKSKGLRLPKAIHTHN